MNILKFIFEVFACVGIIIIALCAGVITSWLFCKIKTVIKNKIQQIKIKRYAVTYLINPKLSRIDNKNDDDIRILSFGAYQHSTRIEYIKARSKPQAIAKFYTNNIDRTCRIKNFDDVLVIAVNEITFAK